MHSSLGWKLIYFVLSSRDKWFRVIDLASAINSGGVRQIIIIVAVTFVFSESWSKIRSGHVRFQPFLFFNIRNFYSRHFLVYFSWLPFTIRRRANNSTKDSPGRRVFLTRIFLHWIDSRIQGSSQTGSFPSYDSFSSTFQNFTALS